MPSTTPDGSPVYHELPSPWLWQPGLVSLSTKSGVYWYLDEAEQVLYVGKAKNLRNRLQSYRRLKQLLPRTRKMVQTAKSVRYQETESELDALLLEAELIKTYQPSYNILLKDDKSPLYIVVTKEDFPRIVSVRREGTLLQMKRRYVHVYGPYPSSGKVRHLLKLMRQMFPFCTAKRGLGRACLYYHMGLCPGVCVGTVSVEAYAETIKAIHWFLTGKKYQLNRYLRQRIEVLSKTQQFEEAAKLKRQLEAIVYVTQHYREKLNLEVVPNLSQDLALDSLVHLRRLISRQLRLPANYPLARIECYDVSNIQGKQATTSMVVFTQGKKDASNYRKFRIRTLDTPNDVGMLKEALRRRVGHPEWGMPNLILIDGGRGQLRAARQTIPWSIPVVSIAKRPDRLMVMRSQVSGFRLQVSAENGERMRDLETERKNGDRESDFVAVRLDSRNPGARLLQALRDEAHRFAKTYHGKLHVREITA